MIAQGTPLGLSMTCGPGASWAANNVQCCKRPSCTLHGWCSCPCFAVSGLLLAQDDTCDLPITQEDLGDTLGMSTVHVNRTLMMLRAAGMVEFRGGKLMALDWEKLVEIAEF